MKRTFQCMISAAFGIGNVFPLQSHTCWRPGPPRYMRLLKRGWITRFRQLISHEWTQSLKAPLGVVEGEDSSEGATHRARALVPVLPASWASGLPCAQQFCNKVPSLWPCSASTHSHGTSDCELRPPDSALKQFGCLWTVSGICHSNKIYFST